MYYRKEHIATYYDCDCNNLLKVSGMLRYMQQTSSEHLCSIDISPETLYRKSLVFLLSKTNLKIHRTPVCGEKLSVGTAATEVKGPRFIREFVIDSPDGERLVSAYSLWVLTDTKNHRILRPSAFPYAIPMQPSGLNGAVGDVAIPKNIHAGSTSRIQIPVRYSHIDINAHVNNCFYADFVCDALPYDELTSRGVSILALSFQSEATYGETLEIEAECLGPLAYRVSGTHSEERRFEAYLELSDRPIEFIR